MSTGQPNRAEPAQVEGAPTLDAIAADPHLAQELPRATLEALALRAIAVHAMIATVLLTSAGRAGAATPQNIGEGEEELLLTVPEVARRLGVPAPYVYELARRHEIPTCRLGRYVRIPARALHEWIQEHRVDSRPALVRQSARARGR